MKINLLLLIVIFCALSCKKDNSKATPAAGDFKTGTKWVYKRTVYDESGAVTSSANITYTITGQQTLLGENWQVLSAAGGSGLIRKSPTGFYTVTNNVSQLQFKLPAALNDTWRVTYSSAAGDYSDFTVMALNENVTVPMGTLACYYIEGNDSNSLEDKEWYNEANIMVKHIEYNQTANAALYVNYTEELVSFTP